MQSTKYFNIVPQYEPNFILLFYSIIYHLFKCGGGGVPHIFFIIRPPVCRIIKTIQAYLKQLRAIVHSKISQVSSTSFTAVYYII